MTCTATVVIATSVATVTALAGGTLVAGMTMTYAAQTQPVSPVVTLGSQLTGSAGSNGTYNVNNLTTLSSTTVTFESVQAPGGQMQPVPEITIATIEPTTVPVGATVTPPSPLPQTLFGSTTQTSSST